MIIELTSAVRFVTGSNEGEAASKTKTGRRNTVALSYERDLLGPQKRGRWDTVKVRDASAHRATGANAPRVSPAVCVN